MKPCAGYAQEAARGSPAAFHFVHHLVGGAEQLQARVPVQAAHRHADARGQREEFAVCLERLGKRVRNAFGERACFLDGIHPWKDDHELVSAYTPRALSGSQDVLNAQRRLDERDVTGIVSAGVVNLFEAVEIHVQQRGMRTGLAREQQRAIDQVVHAGTVEQAGELIGTCHARVVFGLPAQLRRLAFERQAFFRSGVQAAQAQSADRHAHRRNEQHDLHRIQRSRRQEDAVECAHDHERRKGRGIRAGQFFPRQKRVLYAEHADHQHQERTGGVVRSGDRRCERHEKASDAEKLQTIRVRPQCRHQRDTRRQQRRYRNRRETQGIGQRGIRGQRRGRVAEHGGNERNQRAVIQQQRRAFAGAPCRYYFIHRICSPGV